MALVDPSLAAFYLLFWAGTCVACAPLLAAGSVRRLVRAGPTARPSVNYVLGVGAFTLLHYAAVLLALLFATRDGGANLLEVFELVVALTVGVVVAGWLGASVGLPALGRWTPTGDGADGRLVLAAGAVWYLLWTAFVVFVVNTLLFLLHFPAE